MIFRKVSDVKKERELAERRKDDPALNQTQDHLVRKLFSKFKKSGPVDPAPPPNVVVRYQFFFYFGHIFNNNFDFKRI
jgi:hypothetical protein